jgi:hypothetical protein
LAEGILHIIKLQEGMMTILAMVNAEKEGQIESKMMKARQLEEIRLILVGSAALSPPLPFFFWRRESFTSSNLFFFSFMRVNAEKEGQIESKMMKARQLEEIREAKRAEAEARISVSIRLP